MHEVLNVAAVAIDGVRGCSRIRCSFTVLLVTIVLVIATLSLILVSVIVRSIAEVLVQVEAVTLSLDKRTEVTIVVWASVTWAVVHETNPVGNSIFDTACPDTSIVQLHVENLVVQAA